MTSDLVHQIRLALQSQFFPVPSTAWVSSLVGTRLPPPALQSLVATAKARILAADLSSPNFLDVGTASLPSDIASADRAETKLARDTVVQVLDIENLSRSRWEQVEDLEAIERGEQRAGRRIVRLPAAGDGGDNDGGDEAQTQLGRSVSAGGTQSNADATDKQAGANATHRLVLQDCKGARVYALELRRVPHLGVGTTMMGEKILLRAGTVVARGTVLLEPATCLVLGGKVDAWQAAWLSGRLQRLREAVGAEDRPK